MPSDNHRVAGRRRAPNYARRWSLHRGVALGDARAARMTDSDRNAAGSRRWALAYCVRGYRDQAGVEQRQVAEARCSSMHSTFSRSTATTSTIFAVVDAQGCWRAGRTASSSAQFEQGEIGPDLFRAACNMGLEGLVSKRRDRRYRGDRSKDWIKVKNRKHHAMHREL
jgi:hypothetical protein